MVGVCRRLIKLLFAYQTTFAYQAVLGDQTAFGLYPLLFIRKLRCSLVVCFGFTNEEYLNALVDFIGSSRGRLERDRGLRIPYPSPTPLLTPLGDPLRRGISAAAGLYQFRISVSGADCSSPLRRIVWVLCVRAEIVRVSENHARHMSFVFHYWLKKRRC